MGLYEYKMLEKKKQWKELWNNGKFIARYIDEGIKLSLYALHVFFVEVELNVATNKIIGKGEFVCGHSLDKYSGGFDVINLYSKSFKGAEFLLL